MSPRTGRPRLENVREFKVEIRMNHEEMKKLDDCCAKTKMSRSELIRAGIDRIYKEDCDPQEK